MSKEISLAYVGAWLPGSREESATAFSQAGTFFQQRLVESVASAGCHVSRVFSLRPVASYPVDRRLWFRPETTRFLDRFPATLLPFVNLGAAKTLTSGFALLPLLLCWAWRERDRRRVILLYNMTSPPGLASVLAGWLSRTKVVALIADIQVPGDGLVPDNLLRRMEFALLRRTLPLADGLIVLTSRMALDFAPGTPFLQMEGAVDERLGEPTVAPDTGKFTHPPAGSAEDPFIILYAGHLSALKGIPLLLEAFRMLDGDRFQLWITGAGPLHDQVEKAVLGDPRITFWGFPAHEDLLALYQCATVLVNPHSTLARSARYLFPSKLMEYLATGKPVVSTRSTPEVEEEYGDLLFLLPTETPDELAELIRRLAALPEGELLDRGRRGRRFVLSRKSWEVQGARILHFIQRGLEPEDRIRGNSGAPGDGVAARS